MEPEWSIALGYFDMKFVSRKKTKFEDVIQILHTLSTLGSFSYRSGSSKCFLQMLCPEDSSIEPCWIFVPSACGTQFVSCLISCWSEAWPDITIYKPEITTIAPNKLKWDKYIRWPILSALISYSYLFLFITNRILHKENKLSWKHSEELCTLTCRSPHVER